MKRAGNGGQLADVLRGDLAACVFAFANDERQRFPGS